MGGFCLYLLPQHNGNAAEIITQDFKGEENHMAAHSEMKGQTVSAEFTCLFSKRDNE